jgi:hypothetical protein
LSEQLKSVLTTAGRLLNSNGNGVWPFTAGGTTASWVVGGGPAGGGGAFAASALIPESAGAAFVAG